MAFILEIIVEVITDLNDYWEKTWYLENKMIYQQKLNLNKIKE